MTRRWLSARARPIWPRSTRSPRRSAFPASGSSTAPTNGAAPRCARDDGRAVAGAHARLAVPGARPPCRDRPHGGPAGEFYSVTWPGFVGVLTAMAPGRFCGRDQPGAAVAAHAASVAAALRHRGQRDRDLVAAAHSAGSAAAPGVRDLRDFAQARARLETDADRAAGDLHARRLRAGRALRDRAHRGRLLHPHREHRRGE